MSGVLHIWRRAPRSFGANAILTSVTNVIIAFVGIGTGVTTARLLGPHGRGELAAIQNWPVLIGYLAMLGSGDALIYYSAREPQRAGSYLGSAGVITLLASVPLMLAAYPLMPFLLAAQSASVVQAACGYLLMVPLIGLASLPLNSLRGRNDFLVWNV